MFEWETDQMTTRTFFLGSLAVLPALFSDHSPLLLPRGSDVVILPTAAAFTGATEAAVATSTAIEQAGHVVEALMVTDRASANEPYFAQRACDAAAIVVTDGSALHARSTWRDTPLGEALRAASVLVVIGESTTVLGEHMIDPRGGAPTTGLNYRPGAVVTTLTSSEQRQRSRDLLANGEVLIELGPLGIVANDNGDWLALSASDVYASRAGVDITLNSR